MNREKQSQFAKRPGETKIVAVMAHDVNHNGVAQELYIRSILEPMKNCRIICVRSSKLFTPQLIEDADLLITSRSYVPDPIDLTTDAVTDTVIPGVIFWSDTNAGAVIDNVSTRGMGFLALHCTLLCGNKDITDFMGVQPLKYRELNPIWMYDFNQDHPITQGMETFWMDMDEQFAAVIKNKNVISLFNTHAMHDKRTAAGGWCIEQGKGRVVCLLPGHTASPYKMSEYREIVWRSVHWAMRKDVTPPSKSE